MQIPENESAAELFERAERETGQRVDTPNSDAMLVVFGAAARALGEGKHRPRDDFAAGTLIRHQLSPAGKKQRQSDQMLAMLLGAGMDPETISEVFGKKD